MSRMSDSLPPTSYIEVTCDCGETATANSGTGEVNIGNYCEHCDGYICEACPLEHPVCVDEAAIVEANEDKELVKSPCVCDIPCLDRECKIYSDLNFPGKVIEEFAKHNPIVRETLMSCAVSKAKESKVHLQKDKWYIICKPIPTSSSDKIEETHKNFGKIKWVARMDKFDGKIVQCERVTAETAATFKGICGFQFHNQWTQGPFETKEDALRTKIKITSRREPDIVDKAYGGITKFENGRIKWMQAATPTYYDANTCTMHLKDPETGIISKITDEEVEMKTNKKITQKVRDRWAKEKAKSDDQKVEQRFEYLGYGYSAYSPQDNVAIKRSAPVTDEVVIGTPGQPVTIAGIDIKDLSEKVEAMVEPKALVKRKIKSLDKKYDKEIDNIFSAYHKRNDRRKELNERITREFNKDKPSVSLKRRLLTFGSTVAITGSAYVLWPYAGGLLYYIGL